MNEAEKVLRETGIIAIVRHAEAQFILPMAEALYAGGIRMMEVTMNTVGAADMIRTLRAAYDGKIMIGAGTVTDPTRLQEAVAAGAQFIVTPNVCPEVISWCVEHDLLITPGALTPSEICTATSLGCKYVKLFPAGTMGVPYFKAVRGPLSDVHMLVVGGISSTNLEEYLAAGAIGAGVGGGLCKMQSLEDAERITQEARALTALRAKYPMK